MKKFFLLLVIICVIVLVVFLGQKFFFSKEMDKIQYVSEIVQKRTIQVSISATGTLEPVDQVEIGTQVSGDIAKIHVDFNDKVKKGQILAELDKSKLQTTLVQSEIALGVAENDYSHKKSVLERVKKLSENGSASAVELENAEYDFRSAELSLKRAKNEVASARLNLSYCTIKSPIDGVVLERSVDVGQTVAASMSAPTLFILAKDLSRMRVMASVDEADIGSVQSGQNVEFSVDAFMGEVFHGKVKEVRLNPITTSNVVTYTVVIEAENKDLKLLPGMTATCIIITKKVSDALSVSAKALKFKPSLKNGKPKVNPKMFNPNVPKRERDAVFKLNGNKPMRVPVSLGLSDGVFTQVLSGISEGDSVIVSEISQELKKEKAPSSEQSPFMPGPPGKRKK